MQEGESSGEFEKILPKEAERSSVDGGAKSAGPELAEGKSPEGKKEKV